MMHFTALRRLGLWCVALETLVCVSGFTLAPWRYSFALPRPSPFALFATRKKKSTKNISTVNKSRKSKSGVGFDTEKISGDASKNKGENVDRLWMDQPSGEETKPLARQHQSDGIESSAAQRTKWIKEVENEDSQKNVEEEVIQSKNAVARKVRRQKWVHRVEDSEISGTKAIYMREYQQQLELASSSTPIAGRLYQISKDPLIFTIDDFIDPAACETVKSNGAGCFDLMYPERISDLLFQGQENEMDGLLFNVANSQQHSQKGVYPDGLHIDTNGPCLFRHVTCLLYLNTIPQECGGATVFPLARSLPNDPALIASKRLLALKISHTRSESVAEAGLTNEALLLESRFRSNFADDDTTNTALRIQPKAGRLLLFFSRTSNGQEDPRAWHSGEHIKANGGGVTEKRILTLFKQVHYNPLEMPGAQANLVQTTFEDYLSPQIQEQQNWLQWKAQDKSSVWYSS